MKCFSKEDIRDSLGVSLATVNNWIKTSIIPAPDYGDKYTENAYKEIVKIIKNGKLNGRANRSQIDTKFITYLGIKDKIRKNLLEQIIERFENSGLSTHEGVIALAITMLKTNNLFIEDTVVYKKITTWIEEINSNLSKLSIFSNFKIINMDDDFIGAFYQSIQSISAKSVTGSYYTPSELLTTLKVENNKRIIDPCCGSGSILLNVLSKNHDPSLIYARDIDSIALQICEVNLVMFFNDPNITTNICHQDLLFDESNKEKFDYIVTNPPWGSKFSEQQKELLVSLYPEISTTESFGVALYKALKMLSEEGELYFFLPYSFLNVSAHKNIRKYILDSISQIKIKLLGKAFKGVLSEAILLKLKKRNNDENCLIEIEDKKGKTYNVNRYNIVAPDYIISATSSNNDEEILKKIFNSEHFTLLDNTDFALGIVTGNNKEHVLEKKTDKTEPIYRGKDIIPYHFLEPKCFIEFKPEKYQQVAPLKYFRTKKIVYRFISDKIVCTLDENNNLVLNSANFFIPHSYPMETIVCLFNSPIYSFIYRKKYHSTKVLKSHIQNMPLPKFSKEEHLRFMDLYKEIYNGNIKQDDIDSKICNYFGLLDEEYIYIKESINGTT